MYIRSRYVHCMYIMKYCMCVSTYVSLRICMYVHSYAHIRTCTYTYVLCMHGWILYIGAYYVSTYVIHPYENAEGVVSFPLTELWKGSLNFDCLAGGGEYFSRTSLKATVCEGKEGRKKQSLVKVPRFSSTYIHVLYTRIDHVRTYVHNDTCVPSPQLP